MADEKEFISQDDLDRLLSQRSAQERPEEAPGQASPEDSSGGTLTQSEIEALLQQGVSSASEGGPAAGTKAFTRDTAQSGKPPEPAGVEQLLGQPGGARSPGPPAASGKTRDASPAGQEALAAGDVEYLLHQAQRALESLDSEPASAAPPGLAAFHLDELKGEPASTETATLDLISDVQLDLKIELGRTNMYLEDVLRLRRGSVVALDKLAGDPVDIYVNERLIARGEVLVLNDNFCVRVGELIAGANPGG